MGGRDVPDASSVSSQRYTDPLLAFRIADGGRQMDTRRTTEELEEEMAHSAPCGPFGRNTR